MFDDSPGFGVDFEIDAGGSVAEITQLADLMQSTEAKMVGNANGIETATRCMIDMKRASADVKAFSDDARHDHQRRRLHRRCRCPARDPRGQHRRRQAGAGLGGAGADPA